MTRSDHFNTAWKNLTLRLASTPFPEDSKAWYTMFYQAMAYSMAEVNSARENE